MATCSTIKEKEKQDGGGMARKLLSIRKVREVLWLHFGAGLSALQIVASCNLGRSTIGEYLQRAQGAGLRWPLPENLDDTRLEAALFKRPICSNKQPLPDMNYLHTEMGRKGVIL